jgi:alanyl-tRNA synthetase
VAALRDAEKELEQLRAQLVLGNAAGLAAGAVDVRGTAFVGTEAPEGTTATDVRTLAQEIRGRLDPGRPAVVAVAVRAGGKASLVVAVNGAARQRDVSAAGLVKGALSGRGGGSPELAQGGGVPAGEAPALLAAVRDALP